MRLNNKHLILIGFKHTGKTAVGQLLAAKLHCDFIDSDMMIEQSYRLQYHLAYTGREIYQVHGESFFRTLERQTLTQLLNNPPSVIALGGGTPMAESNQIMIKAHLVIHITASPEVVFARIMAAGKPAFFPEQENPQLYFQRLWTQRQKIYQALAEITVDNSGAVAETVEKILEKIS
ncbi:MAG: shikimate kinase [Proteobacteria bacterium]|nr:shikimate kinase [Pseudomonadota bacterium]